MYALQSPFSAFNFFLCSTEEKFPRSCWKLKSLLAMNVNRYISEYFRTSVLLVFFYVVTSLLCFLGQSWNDNNSNVSGLLSS